MSRYIWVAFGLLIVCAVFTFSNPLRAETPDAADVTEFTVTPSRISPGGCVWITWKVTGEAYAELWRGNPDGTETRLSVGLDGNGPDCPPWTSGTIPYWIDSSVGLTFRYVTVEGQGTPTLIPTATGTMIATATPTATATTAPPTPTATATTAPPTPTATATTAPPTPTATATPLPPCPPQVIAPPATPAFWEYVVGKNVYLPLTQSAGRTDCIDTGEVIHVQPRPIPQMSFRVGKLHSDEVNAAGASTSCFTKQGVDDVGSSATAEGEVCLSGTHLGIVACIGADCTSAIGFNEQDGEPAALTGDIHLEAVTMSSATLLLTDTVREIVPGPLGTIGDVEFLAFPTDNTTFWRDEAQLIQSSSLEQTSPPQWWVDEVNARMMYKAAKDAADGVNSFIIPVSSAQRFWDKMHIVPTTPLTCGETRPQLNIDASIARLSIVSAPDGDYVMWGKHLILASQEVNYCMWGFSPPGPEKVYLDWGKFRRSTAPQHQKLAEEILSTGGPLRPYGVVLSNPGWQLDIPQPPAEEVFIFSTASAIVGGAAAYLIRGVQVSAGVVANFGSFIIIPTEDLECWILGGQEFCKVIDG